MPRIGRAAPRAGHRHERLVSRPMKFVKRIVLWSRIRARAHAGVRPGFPANCLVSGPSSTACEKQKKQKPTPNPAQTRFTPEQEASSPAAGTSMRFDSGSIPKYRPVPFWKSTASTPATGLFAPLPSLRLRKTSTSLEGARLQSGHNSRQNESGFSPRRLFFERRMVQ